MGPCVSVARRRRRPGINPINNGLDFKRVDGRWKVTHLVPLHEQTASHLAFAKAFVGVFDDGATTVDHGDYARAEDAVKAVTEELLPVYEAERPADRAGRG